MPIRYLVVLALLLFTGCGRGVSAADNEDNRQALENKLKQLVADRVESAKMTQMAVQAAFEAETVTMDLLVWATNAQFKADLAAAPTVDERIAAHAKRLQGFRLLFEKIKSLWEVGARGGESEKYSSAKYCMEDAEIALIEECITSGRPYPKQVVIPAVETDPAEQ
jgi:hypothetical protein